MLRISLRLAQRQIVKERNGLAFKRAGRFFGFLASRRISKREKLFIALKMEPFYPSCPAESGKDSYGVNTSLPLFAIIMHAQYFALVNVNLILQFCA